MVQKRSTQKNLPKEFAFGKEKFRLLLISLGVITLGFILMIGGHSDNPKIFNESIFNFQRLTIAPVLVLLGYGMVLFTILKKPKKNHENR